MSNSVPFTYTVARPAAQWLQARVKLAFAGMGGASSAVTKWVRHEIAPRIGRIAVSVLLSRGRQRFHIHSLID